MNDFHFIMGYISGALDRRGHSRTWRVWCWCVSKAGIRSGDYGDGYDCGYDTYTTTIHGEWFDEEWADR